MIKYSEVFMLGKANGKAEVISELSEKMNSLWKKYEEDPVNVPRPDFMSAYALIAMMEE